MADFVFSARDRSALRRATRFACQVVEEDSFSLVGSECLDLSFNGMAVRALKLVPLGSSVIVSFRLPGTTYVCDLEGEVARVMRGRRCHDSWPALGIRFREVEPLTRAMLSARLCGVPPPAPARPLRRDYAATLRRLAA